ncbi:MAG: hypothetical protein H0X37_17375 [Herpetosiphonaceae bacterium]|nr:hypothetical protein [Herpetosiphonaceae bacterium]
MLEHMNGQWEALAQLYEHDHERATLLAEEQAVREQLREGEVVAALVERRRMLGRQLKDERERVSDLAWELEETEQRLASLVAAEAAQDDILGAREVAALRKRKAALEDGVLHHMEQIEVVEQEQIEAEADWLRHSSTWAERSGSIRAAAEHVAQQLAIVNAVRDTLLAALSQDDRERYLAAAQRHPMTPIAYVEQGQCEGCRTPLAPTLITDLPALCPTCARILLPFV